MLQWWQGLNEQDESKQRRHTYADKNQCAVLSGLLAPIALQTLQSITALEQWNGGFSSAKCHQNSRETPSSEFT